MALGEQWLDGLRLAGVAAFLCQRTDAGVVITRRTPAFASVVAKPDAAVDESQLRALLNAALTESAGGAVVCAREPDDRWNCVAVPVPADVGTHLVLVRVPTAEQLRDDVFYEVVQKLPDVVSRHDRRYRHLYVNPAVELATAPMLASDLIGKDHVELGMPADLCRTWQTMYRTVFETGEQVEQEFEFPAADGRRHYLVRALPEFGADGAVRTVLDSARDVSELRGLQRQLEALAQSDPLTALLNRRSFDARMATELQRVRTGAGRLCVLLFDVDRFKAVNDRFGHAVGDDVLVAVAAVLRQEIQVDDFAARLGGDEFCVGLVDTDDADSAAIAERIRGRIGDALSPWAQPAPITISMGVTAATPGDGSVADVMSRVDALMYARKAHSSHPRNRS